MDSRGLTRDRQTLIFWLMNGSLVLDIFSYVLLLTTHIFYFAIGLEVAYLLMPVWAVLLARQIGVFNRPSQPDRTFKFVRAAYVWLVIACGMMPLFPLYGALTHQVFAHTYMGSHRHAFTVGFISMMILGVSSRIVPDSGGHRLQADEFAVGAFHSHQPWLYRPRGVSGTD